LKNRKGEGFEHDADPRKLKKRQETTSLDKSSWGQGSQQRVFELVSEKVLQFAKNQSSDRRGKKKEMGLRRIREEEIGKGSIQTNEEYIITQDLTRHQTRVG